MERITYDLLKGGMNEMKRNRRDLVEIEEVPSWDCG